MNLQNVPGVDYEDPQLARMIESLPPSAVDRLPFGAIRLSRHGVVEYYSEAERRLSGSAQHPRHGLDFFASIAPCMDTPEYRGRIEAALAGGTLDLRFDYVGDFEDRARELEVRVQSATAGGYWIFMRRA
jgi:photoactive yellow protein